MKSLGIDIGSSSIKVVEAQWTKKGLQINRFTEFPLGQNPAYDSDIEIIETLKKLSSDYEGAKCRIVVGLSQDKVSVRFKTFPFNDRIKIVKSLPFELEEDLPYSSDTTLYDGKIIKTLGPTAEVLCCATPKKRIEKLFNQIQTSNLEISILSPEGLAFANCLENWSAPPPTMATPELQLEDTPIFRHLHFILDIGHTHSLIIAMEDNLMVGVRSLLWGAKNVIESIQKKYSIPYIEAVKEFKTKAFVLANREGASQDQLVFSETIANSIKELGKDVRISLLELQSELSGEFDKGFLTGGGSQIKNLQALLTQALEIPINRYALLTHFPFLQIENNARTDCTIGVALGLAIEGLKRPRNPPVNLLKGEFAPQNKFVHQIWQQWGSSLKAAAIAFVLLFVFSTIKEQISTALNEKASEALKAQAKNLAAIKKPNQEEIKKYLREQKKQIHEAKTVSNYAKMNSALDVLKKINDSLPAKGQLSIDMKKISIEDNDVLIEGSVGTSNEIQLLRNALNSLSSDGNVTSGSPQNQGRGVPFSFQFKVDRGLTTKQ